MNTQNGGYGDDEYTMYAPFLNNEDLFMDEDEKLLAPLCPELVENSTISELKGVLKQDVCLAEECATKMDFSATQNPSLEFYTGREITDQAARLQRRKQQLSPRDYDFDSINETKRRTKRTIKPVLYLLDPDTEPSPAKRKQIIKAKKTKKFHDDRKTELSTLRSALSSVMREKEDETTKLRSALSSVMREKENETTKLRSALSTVMREKEDETTKLRNALSSVMREKEDETTKLKNALSSVTHENENLKNQLAVFMNTRGA